LASRHALSSLLPPLLTYVALHLAAAGLTPTLNALQALVNERLVGQVTLRVLAKVNTFTDLSRFEDPMLYDDLKTIGERAPNLPRNLLRSLTEVVQAVLATAGLS